MRREESDRVVEMLDECAYDFDDSDQGREWKSAHNYAIDAIRERDALKAAIKANCEKHEYCKRFCGDKE